MNRLVRKTLRMCGLYDAAVAFKNWLTNTEAEYVRFYSQFVSEGDLCFDVGANVGRRTGVFLKLGASVVAVEPQAHCMNILRKKYGADERVVLVEKALGDKEGEAQMLLCDSHSLSSLSKEWIESVRASGRYSERDWDKTVTVPVATLDALVGEYGSPSFLKVDVEGYEYEVFKGLSEPLGVVCFEFTPEFMDSAINSVKRLGQIGTVEFNYCLEDEPVRMVLSEWVKPGQMCEILASLRDEKRAGDVYARFEI